MVISFSHGHVVELLLDVAIVDAVSGRSSWVRLVVQEDDLPLPGARRRIVRFVVGRAVDSGTSKNAETYLPKEGTPHGPARKEKIQ